jgi:proteasome lid subunit RPN8/RPN11
MPERAGSLAERSRASARPHDHERVVMSRDLQDRLAAAVAEQFPRKAFGYLVSDGDPYEPKDFLLFEGNVRNTRFWKPRFEAYGRYFVDNNDAGFVATPDEAWRIHRELLRRDLFEVAIFHSHQRHAANFSRIDYELHLTWFESLWHLIISMRNPSYPRLRAFAVSRGGVRELPIVAPA